jgi:predicted dehydrogenase
MDKIKLALVGLSDYMMNTLYRAAFKLPFELVAACDIDESRIETFTRVYRVPRTFTDYAQMIEEVRPEAVLCAANADVHYAVMKLCLEKGIHVFAEKTHCNTYAQALELAQLQKSAGKAAMVGFNRRYTTGYLLADEIAKRDEFGKIALYYSKFHSSPYRSVDYFVFNHIIHHLDLAIYLLGDIEDISVRHRVFSDVNAAFDVDFVSKTGTIGTIQAACLLGEPFPMERLELISAAGRDVIVDNLNDLRYNRSGPRRNVDFSLPLQQDGDCLSWNPSNGYAYGFDYMGFDAMLADFVKAIRTGERTRCDVADCAVSMRAMEVVRAAL